MNSVFKILAQSLHMKITGLFLKYSQSFRGKYDADEHIRNAHSTGRVGGGHFGKNGVFNAPTSKSEFLNKPFMYQRGNDARH